MGSPPPTDAAAPAATSVADPAFPATPTAKICGFGLPKIPRLSFGGLNIKIPKIPPEIPLPHFSFEFQCKPSDPVKLNAGADGQPVPYGGGRQVNRVPDPDLAGVQ